MNEIQNKKSKDVAQIHKKENKAKKNKNNKKAVRAQISLGLR